IQICIDWIAPVQSTEALVIAVLLQRSLQPKRRYSTAGHRTETLPFDFIFATRRTKQSAVTRLLSLHEQSKCGWETPHPLASDQSFRLRLMFQRS
ncbi:MAG: hypothetical protein AAAC47_27325, partial [Pararhizobium sp.]